MISTDHNTDGNRYASRYMRLLRVPDYAKNLFIFAPIFFGAQITNLLLLGKTAGAFIAFSVITSAVYIFNDYHDRLEDQRHPTKRERPLASGTIAARKAAVIGIALLSAGFAASYLLGPGMFYLAGFYVVLNVAYTLRLKHVTIVDIFIIAAGFIIRISLGAAVTGVVLSPWLIIMTFLIALFLALGKRMDDLRVISDKGTSIRRAADGYSAKMLDNAISIITAVLIVSYIMYTLSPDVMLRMHSDKVYTTTFFVLLGIMRYLQIYFTERGSTAPTGIFWKDRFIQLSIIGWIATLACLIYM